MRRNGKVFAAGFRDPVQPEAVADLVVEAITTPRYRLRWPIGKDAIGVVEGRPKMTDEEWIAMGGDLSDDEYNRRFRDHFGIELK
jgi:hypothetical protein